MWQAGVYAGWLVSEQGGMRVRVRVRGVLGGCSARSTAAVGCIGVGYTEFNLAAKGGTYEKAAATRSGDACAQMSMVFAPYLVFNSASACAALLWTNHGELGVRRCEDSSAVRPKCGARQLDMQRARERVRHTSHSSTHSSGLSNTHTTAIGVGAAIKKAHLERIDRSRGFVPAQRLGPNWTDVTV